MSWPTDPRLERTAAEELAVNLFRGIPQPPRAVQYTVGSREVLLTWLGPADESGIKGWRVKRDNEFNIVWQTDERTQRSARISVPSDTPVALIVCSYTELRRESPQVVVKVRANTDSLVAGGTAGATPGASAPPSGDWQGAGGGGRGKLYLEE